MREPLLLSPADGFSRHIYGGRRDLNRCLALSGFSGCNSSRLLTLIPTPIINFSTSPLRLHSDTSDGGGPVLVTAANAAMGHVHIRRQPLYWPPRPYPYHLLLLFRPLTGPSSGSARFGVLPAAQISPASRGGNPDGCWRYQICYTSVRGSDTVLTAILLTRVYALWERNRIILWCLLAYYVGFAGFAGVRDLLHSRFSFSIHRSLVGNYPREISRLSISTTDFTGVYQLLIEG